jgi:hypothetical protein
LTPIAIAILTFVSTFGSALVGMRMRAVLPDHHLDSDSKDTVKLAVGLVATMTALVLGLVTASTKSSFDEQDSAVKQSAAELLSLDRALARYGPETAGIRQGLKRAIEHRVEVMWDQGSRSDRLDPSQFAQGAESLESQVFHLAPRDDDQRWFRDQALKISEQLLDERWIMFASAESSVPVLFIVMLMFWLAITFASFGLFAPQNRTVVAALLVSALSVAGAVFLVLELDSPFDGLIRVSADPVRNAVAHLGQ